MSIILESIKTMVSTKQKEHESLQHYAKRFKTALDVMKSHIGGPLVLPKFVEEMNKYDVVEAKKFQEMAFNQFMAYVYLDNADKAKYGTLLAGLNTQTSLENNQYPKTITEASNVLSNHHFDNAGKIINHKHKENDLKGENNINE
jgi:ribosomal protein S10